MKQIRITKSLVEGIEELMEGKVIAASKLNANLCVQLIQDGYLIVKANGIKRKVISPDPEALYNHLCGILPEFCDIQGLKESLQSENDRAKQAAIAGNSKMRYCNSFHGFALNSFEPVRCLLDGIPFTVNPPAGTFIFIENWRQFTPAHNCVVIGTENMENFSKVKQYSDFFKRYVSDKFPEEVKELLFVTRLLSSNDLIRWLQKISNPYIHFGDFDLAGIQIFLSQYHSKLGEKTSYLIPEDIEVRIKQGNILRYNQQYPKFKNLSSEIPELQTLIDLINRHGRCYDQEGYISKPDKL